MNRGVGMTVDAPAGVGDVVATQDWRVELREVIQGQEVFDRSDIGTKALGEADPSEIPTWIAFRVAATALGDGDQPAYLPPNAFALVDTSGAPAPDVMTLSPPSPDVSGACFPGAARDGWTALALPDAMATVIVRFLPFATLAPDRAPRFFQLVPTIANRSAAGAPLAPGATVAVTEATVNMRDQPSTDGAVVTTLDPSQPLVVDGASVGQGGYAWYPVHVAATGQRGFVAGDFLAAQP
ncbi:MAG TPA: SH3 domain-containing protein [Thermomicrobiales bacterium]|nr:SH3 domain-containing protein [Thermomicrobiales bacterium]